MKKLILKILENQTICRIIGLSIIVFLFLITFYIEGK